jgi:hypothetical protein
VAEEVTGGARKWFRGLTTISIAGIEALDDVFLRQWGDKNTLCIISQSLGP